MSRVLMILEVSQKQAYIFGSNKLRINLQRSDEIRYATSSAFFAQAAPELYRESEHFVYSGGGHTVLQFADLETARAFGRAVSRAALQRFPQMELYQKILPYADTLTPGENLNRLSQELEKKKSRREASFRKISFGMERPASNTGTYCPDLASVPYCPPGWQTTTQTDDLAGKDNFIAVVHIDGNAMGKRVQHIYQDAGHNWQTCVDRLRRFSTSIDKDFTDAYNTMLDHLAAALYPERDTDILPVRKVIGAGDDVCFVISGALALDAAADFLQELASRRNAEDGQPYAACAGIVLIHKKDPFRAAYDLSEELCSNAKRFGAALDPESRISAMDWHIEFGSMTGSLSQIRRNYQTRDGALLNLRPVIVCQPDETLQPGLEARSYSYFRTLIALMGKKASDLPRSKFKQLRDALRQGELETKLALRSMGMNAMLEMGLETRYPDFWKQLLQGHTMERGAFADFSESGRHIRRCLYFDAVELMDHTKLWKEE